MKKIHNEKKIQNTNFENVFWKRFFRIQKYVQEIQILKKKIYSTKSENAFQKKKIKIQKYVLKI